MKVTAMKNNYVKQAKLNSWANKILRETMKDFSTVDLQLETPYGTLLQLTIHLMSAINHWFDFFDQKFTIDWKDDKIDYTNWQDILELWKSTDERFENIVDSFTTDESFEEYFEYSHNIKDHYKMKFSELFLHLSCHSYYHRGQLVMFFRQKNLRISPPVDADDFFKIKI